VESAGLLLEPSPPFVAGVHMVAGEHIRGEAVAHIRWPERVFVSPRKRAVAGEHIPGDAVARLQHSERVVVSPRERAWVGACIPGDAVAQ
jgi:hypothetical protein